MSRWLQASTHGRLISHDSWFGLEDTGLLPFTRFAGFVEAGTRFGYLDLGSFPARADLRRVLDERVAGHIVGPYGSLAMSLRERLAADVQRLSEPRDAAGVAAFESYVRLDEMVRRDLDLREFLAACHSGGPHAKTDAIFLAAPEFFAEALATRRVRRLPVGGQVSGGLQVARALERLSRLLGGLKYSERLRETLILHAQWAHQVDEVFARLEQWIIRAREWNSDASSADDSGRVWAAYRAGTVVPLVEEQRSRGLLASPTWFPAPSKDDALPVQPERSSPSNVEGEIERLSKLADDATSEARANEALSLYAEAARLRAEHLNHEDTTEVLGYWGLIEKVLRLGDRDTAAALCAVAYPALRGVLVTSHRQTLEELMESLRRPRSAGRPGTASGTDDAAPVSSNARRLGTASGGGDAAPASSDTGREFAVVPDRPLSPEPESDKGEQLRTSEGEQPRTREVGVKRRGRRPPLRE